MGLDGGYIQSMVAREYSGTGSSNFSIFPSSTRARTAGIKRGAGGRVGIRQIPSNV